MQKSRLFFIFIKLASGLMAVIFFGLIGGTIFILFTKFLIITEFFSKYTTKAIDLSNNLTFFIWTNSDKISELATAVTIIIGVFFTMFQIRLSRIGNTNSQLSSIYEAIQSHNENVLSDEYKREALLQFNGGSRINFHNDKDYHLYAAARALHLQHLNLAAQIWLLSGSLPKLPKDHENWERFTYLIVHELKTIRSQNHPDWYIEACDDLWQSILRKEESYPVGFVKWLNNNYAKFEKKNSKESDMPLSFSLKRIFNFNKQL